MADDDHPTEYRFNGRTYKPHPVADCFPLMTGSAFRDLVDDLRQNGMTQPVLVLGDYILDGRNGLLAAFEAGLTMIPVKELPRNTAAVALATSLNIHRRHMTASQCACVCTNLLDLSQRAYRANHPDADLPDSESADASDPCSASWCAGHVGAAEWYGADRDGLLQDWNGRVWVFPPPDRAEPFLDKLLGEFDAEHIEAAAALVPMTPWADATLEALGSPFFRGLAVPRRPLGYRRPNGSVVCPPRAALAAPLWCADRASRRRVGRVCGDRAHPAGRELALASIPRQSRGSRLVQPAVALPAASVTACDTSKLRLTSRCRFLPTSNALGDSRPSDARRPAARRRRVRQHAEPRVRVPECSPPGSRPMGSSAIRAVATCVA